ncbi:MAG: DEAD/DEAH box helicase, partial [Alphaproteobacteria bacterium]
MESFQELELNDVLETSLRHMKYDKPTPIQAQAIPVALQGQDILGSAQTGTGKTAAFSIPLVQHLLNNPKSAGIILTPTRELGKQVMDIIRQLLGPKPSVKTAFLIGGEPIHKQNIQLKKRPRLVVGTPGRINDHLKRGSLHLDQTDFLILDETDRMLDMGFSIQIDDIVKHLKATRQTLMFSATMPDNIIKMSNKYLNNPQRISVGSTFNPAKNITQDIIRVKDITEKYNTLNTELTSRDGSIIVFVKTKYGTDKLAKKLRADGHSAEAIHGDLKQSKRERVIRDYRAKKFRILVATDVVARGLDVPHVEHVINYDLPQVPEDYIHRIGRTARAGKKGSALCLISPQDGGKWHEIDCLMNPEKKKERSPSGGHKKKRPPRRNNASSGRFNPDKKRSRSDRRDDRPSSDRPKRKRPSRDSEGSENSEG